MPKSRTISKIMAALTVFIALDAAAEGKPDFAWLSIAPEIGYAFQSKGTLDKDYGIKLPVRHSLLVKGHVDIGGDKLALELAPLYALERCHAPVGNLNALGGEMTLVYRFNMTNTYPSIGIGFHGAYLFSNDRIENGTELYGRIPLGLTWYFLKYLGLVFDAGFMFGGTGVKLKASSNQEISNIAGDMKYAFTLGFDILIGLRFP